MTPDLILLLALTPIIVASAISDLRSLKISNRQVLVALALFVVLGPLLLDLRHRFHFVFPAFDRWRRRQNDAGRDVVRALG